MHIRRDRRQLAGARSRTYVSLAHNTWSMGKNGRKQARPVVFAHLGAEDELDPGLVRGMRSALDRLIEQLEARDAAKKGPGAEGPSGSREPAMEALATKVRVHERGLRILASRQLGLRQVVDGVWKRLGVDKVLTGFVRQRRVQFDFERVVFAMVLNRLVDPGSKLACNQWIQDEVWFPEGADWDVHVFYRALDLLEEHSDELSAALLASSRRRLPADELRLLLMDTTSSFVSTGLDDVERAEIAAEWEEHDAGRGPAPALPRPQVINDPAVRMRGHSRDHRPDKPQIVVGLVAGSGGRVLRHKVYPGNRQDQRITLDLLGDVRALAPRGRPVVVTDSGMAGEPNLTALDALGVDRITAVPIRSLAKAEEVLARPGRWRQHPTKAHLKVRVVEIKDSARSGRPEVFIATRNARTAAAQLRALDKNIERVQQQLDKDSGVDEHGVATCKMIAKPAQRRLVRVSADGRRLLLDRDAIRRERRLAGVHLLRTTLVDVDAMEVIAAYQGLLRVENDFRLFKGPLLLRPMHHRLAHRIRAHVLICVLALVVRQEVERLTGQSFEEVAQRVKGVTATRMKDGNHELWMRSEWPEDALPLLDKLGVRKGARSWSVVGPGSNDLNGGDEV